MNDYPLFSVALLPASTSPAIEMLNARVQKVTRDLCVLIPSLADTRYADVTQTIEHGRLHWMLRFGLVPRIQQVLPCFQDATPRESISRASSRIEIDARRIRQDIGQAQSRINDCLTLLLADEVELAKAAMRTRMTLASVAFRIAGQSVRIAERDKKTSLCLPGIPRWIEDTVARRVCGQLVELGRDHLTLLRVSYVGVNKDDVDATIAPRMLRVRRTFDGSPVGRNFDLLDCLDRALHVTLTVRLHRCAWSRLIVGATQESDTLPIVPSRRRTSLKRSATRNGSD